MNEPIFAKSCIKYAIALPIFLLILPYLLGGTLGDIGAYFQLIFILDIVPIIIYIFFYNYQKKKYMEWKVLNKKFNIWEKEERIKLKDKYRL